MFISSLLSLFNILCECADEVKYTYEDAQALLAQMREALNDFSIHAYLDVYGPRDRN